MAKMANSVLAQSPLGIGASRVHFNKWQHVFEPTSDPLGFLVSMCFSWLGEYLPFLEGLGNTFEYLTMIPCIDASVVAKATKIPSIRVFMMDVIDLLKEILIPTISRGYITQHVESIGLPN